MAVIEIQAKSILMTIRQPDDVFGLNYNMNLYRGCQHQCIYCDSRSECYQIENFQDILVKSNALELLGRELPRKRKKGVIGTGSMNDPYMPLEKQYNLTRGALTLIATHGFGAHIITKSDLVLRDVDVLQAICSQPARVCLSVSTADDELARKIEPGAPLPSARFQAIRELSRHGITAGVCMMPVLPFLEDTPDNLRAIIERAEGSGAEFVIPWFGMSMRDRQRAYYYEQLDRLFPGLRVQYERAFGDQYSCPARGANQLSRLFYELCARRGIKTRIPRRETKPSGGEPKQLALFR
jgi:DNA repair photolyase